MLSPAVKPASPPAITQTLTYKHKPPIDADLKISTDGSLWYVDLVGGGNEEDGAAIAADCEVRAVGHKTGQVIQADLIPFEADSDDDPIGYDAEEVKGLSLSVTLTDNGATVTDADVYKLCPVLSDFIGDYIKG